MSQQISHMVPVTKRLWDALQVMAEDMAVTPDALVNQAVFSWLKANGYVLPGSLSHLIDPAIDDANGQQDDIAVDVLDEARGSMSLNEEGAELTPLVDAGSMHSEGLVAALETRVADISSLADLPFEEVQTGESALPPEASRQGTVVFDALTSTLFVHPEGRNEVQVTKGRFIVGRGPQCDLVIDSPRVSREHAMLVREGRTFYIEDLGSSNGTWLDGERITRKQVENGDVFILGSETIAVSVRGNV